MNNILRCKILIGFFLQFFFTETLCVSWEEWWTYDGISGKFYIIIIIL